jgi:hypothetical protein
MDPLCVLPFFDALFVILSSTLDFQRLQAFKILEKYGEEDYDNVVKCEMHSIE